MKRIVFSLLMLIVTLPLLKAQQESRGGEWTIMETFDIPGKASGLAWDGQYLYFGIYGSGGDEFYRFDPQTGEATLLFNHLEVEDSFGMTCDGENLWVIHQPSGGSNPALATEIDFSGNTLSTISLPDHYMSGIAWDDGDFWVCTYYPDPGTTYNIDGSGTLISQFNAPVADQVWDVCLQDEFLWFADYYADVLYKTDLSGTFLEQHDAENIKPSGIVFDGSFLWYVDGPLSSDSKLYKVDLGGAGTPEIALASSSHNFGNVAIGDSAIWNLSVSNLGTANLEIENLVVPNAVPIFSWETYPQTIEPGNTIQLELIYKPTEVGALNTLINIQSNDPINPELEIELTGEAVISGPAIRILDASHDYGVVRAGACTRWFLMVESIGDENLVIESITSNSEAFIVDENIEFPLHISPLAAENLGIWFHPNGAVAYEGILVLSSNDPAYPEIEIPLTGDGESVNYPTGSDLWQFNITTGYDQSPKAIGSLNDITGDGVNEVIVASEDNFVRCFNGNSDVNADVLWEHEIYSGSVYQGEALSFLSDIDGDDADEVVVGTTGGDRSVTVLSGKTGDQIWKFNTTTWGDGGWVYEVDASRDFTQDNIPDVLACAGGSSPGPGAERVFCLNGSDGSLVWDYFINGPGFSVIAINDVNDDGIPEALAGASIQNETQGIVICVDGSTGNSLWVEAGEGSSVWGLVQLDDINGDGVDDVASGEFVSGDYKAHDASSGDVLFDGSVGGGYAIITDLVRLEDVNDDGYADFSIASNSTNCVVINGFDGSNIWLTPLVDQSANMDRIPDISGDGINDLIVGTYYQSNYVYFLNGANGDIIKSLDYDQPVDAISAIPDIVGDVSWEVVAGGRNGKVTCFSGGLDAYTSLPEHAEFKTRVEMAASPNPFTDMCNISIKLEKGTTGNLSVLSAGGKMVYDFGVVESSDESLEIFWDGKSLNGENLSPGLYFVVFSNERYTKVLKLIRK